MAGMYGRYLPLWPGGARALRRPVQMVRCRYFLHSWPKLCFMAFDGAHCFGTVVCKMDMHGDLLRGYIAMLVVEHAYRGLGVGAPSLSCCQLLLQCRDSVCLRP